MEKIIIEYNIIFKDNTELYDEFDGEFISENKNETDEIFENNKEQIDQYFSKCWIADGENYIESDVEVFYSAI